MTVTEEFSTPELAVHSFEREGDAMELIIALVISLTAFTVSLIALIVVAKNSRRS